MPRVSQMYPSKWLAAVELDESDLTVTITGIANEPVTPDESKWVLYFQETDKGLVLNKTNTRTIAALYGDDTDDWLDRPITLYPTWVDFQGKQVEAIRVRPKPSKAAKKPAGKASGKPAPMTQEEADVVAGDGDIPF